MAPRSLAHVGSVFRVLFVLFVATSRASAQDEADARERLKLMQTAIASLEPAAAEKRSKAALTFGEKPLLRYSDPTRGGIKEVAVNNVLLDAGVWRLGTEGRPTALVTLEIYQERDGARVLAYEFLSLSEQPFALKHRSEPVHWEATGSALEMRPLPDAPRPAAAAPARLAQMRQLARRFGATERLGKESIECRLLSQPLDRYESKEGRITDGALFALANGTNPEVGVVLESDAEHWRYGTLRMTAAESHITLDGQEVAVYEPYNARGRTDGPYFNTARKFSSPRSPVPEALPPRRRPGETASR